MGTKSYSSLAFKVRSEVRRCLLEQCEVLDDAVSVHDDDLVGHCVRCVVPAAHVQAGRRVGDRLREPGEERHCQAGRLD